MTAKQILEVSFLPDLSMPKYLARFGEQTPTRARNVLYNVLKLLKTGVDEWVGLRYYYIPNSANPQERLKLFFRIQCSNSNHQESELPGYHLINEFYASVPISDRDAMLSLKEPLPSIFSIKKDEELLVNKKKDFLYYVPVPFEKASGMDSIYLDSLFDSLTAPCLVDISIKPTALDPAVAFDLIKVIQDLEVMNSTIKTERKDHGALEDLVSVKDIIAGRHRDFYQKYFDTMFSDQIYEFAIRVISNNQREGNLIAHYLGQSIVPNGRFKVIEYKPNHEFYSPLKTAIEKFEYFQETFFLPNKTVCRSEKLAKGIVNIISHMEAHSNRAAQLSELCNLIDSETASRMLQLPTSQGNYLNTIRIESELREIDNKNKKRVGSIEIGEEISRTGKSIVETGQLQKHVFITGVTGSGKTTTIVNILIQLWEKHKIPFLVFEPAKSEYRILSTVNKALGGQLRFFSVGNDRLSPFRFNPLEVPVGTTIEEHISSLEMCFTGAIPMAGPLPSLMSEAIEDCYRNAGFKLSDFIKEGTQIPIMKDIVRSANKIMSERGYVGEIKENLQTAIDVRLKSLCRRNIGRIFSSYVSCPSIDEILKYPTVLELESLNLDQQNLLILFLLTSIRERLRSLGQSNKLRHFIVIEEAHNLIGAPTNSGQISEGYADPKGHATRLLVKLLAEVRAIGEGILVADQTPSAIAPEVLKNTSVKIVHRTVTEDDRDTLASAMLMDQFDHEELARLQTGEVFIYHEMLYRPIRVGSLPPAMNSYIPTDAQLCQLIRNLDWYKKAGNTRLTQIKYQMETILCNLKAMSISLIKLLKRDCRQSFSDSQSKNIHNAVQKAYKDMDEILASATLDPALSRIISKVGIHYRARMKYLIEEVSKALSLFGRKNYGK